MSVCVITEGKGRQYFKKKEMINNINSGKESRMRIEKCSFTSNMEVIGD